MKTVRRSGGGHVRSVPRLVSGVTLRAHAHDVRCDTQHSTRARRATLGGEVAGLDAPTNDLLQHPVLYVQHTHCCKVCAAAEVQRAHALTLPLSQGVGCAWPHRPTGLRQAGPVIGDRPCHRGWWQSSRLYAMIRGGVPGSFAAAQLPDARSRIMACAAALLTLCAAPNSLLLMMVHTSWLCAGERFACIFALLLAAHDSSGTPSVNAPSQGSFRGPGTQPGGPRCCSAASPGAAWHKTGAGCGRHLAAGWRSHTHPARGDAACACAFALR